MLTCVIPCRQISLINNPINLLHLYQVHCILLNETELHSDIIYIPKAHDTRTRNSCELTRARNLYVCHTDFQQDISRASFSHQIERVLFRANFSWEFLVRVSRASVMGFMSFCISFQSLVHSPIRLPPTQSVPPLASVQCVWVCSPNRDHDNFPMVLSAFFRRPVLNL